MRHSRRLAIVLAASLAASACASGGSPGAVATNVRSGSVGGATGAPRSDSAIALANVPTRRAADEQNTTMVIVVRHAEKSAVGGADPHLSDAGEARARALAQALEDAGVNAVITTQFVRTEETAAPTARAAGVMPEVVPVKWDSVAQNAAAIAAAVRRHVGGVVLVVGHSNTVPDIVAALGADRPEEICDAEYDRMEIVTVQPGGGARLIESRYGMPTAVAAGCRSMR